MFILELVLLSSLTFSGMDDDVSIVVTFQFLEELVNEVSGGQVSVTPIIPGDVDPHFFEMETSDYLKLDNADRIFWIGVNELEGCVIEGFSETDKVKLRNIGMGITVKNDEFTGKGNPYVWLDSGNVMTIINNMAHELSEIFPQKDKEFHSNAVLYINKLVSAREDLVGMAQTYKAWWIVEDYPIFKYFFDMIGMRRIAVVTENDETSQQKIANIVDIVNTYEKVVFVTTPHIKSSAVDIICQDSVVKHAVLLAFPSDETYIQMLYNNFFSIEESIKGTEEENYYYYGITSLILIIAIYAYLKRR
ncbi:MAG: metal ABC transporter substrate-binding protein [Candidatus Methanofastidiosia archaeon]